MEYTKKILIAAATAEQQGLTWGDLKNYDVVGHGIKKITPHWSFDFSTTVHNIFTINHDLVSVAFVYMQPTFIQLELPSIGTSLKMGYDQPIIDETVAEEFTSLKGDIPMIIPIIRVLSGDPAYCFSWRELHELIQADEVDYFGMTADHLFHIYNHKHQVNVLGKKDMPEENIIFSGHVKTVPCVDGISKWDAASEHDLDDIISPGYWLLLNNLRTHLKNS